MKATSLVLLYATLVGGGCNSSSQSDKTGSRAERGAKESEDRSEHSEDDAEDEDGNDHVHEPLEPKGKKEKKGASPESRTKRTGEEATSVTPPTPPAPSPPATPSPPVPPSESERFKAMLAAGKVMNTVMIDKANPALDPAGTSNNWFTSPAKRLEVYVAVDASGNPIVPQTDATQIPSGTVTQPEDAKFTTRDAPLATMHSALRVCNNTDRPIYLHSGLTAPFDHGAGPIAIGSCAQLLVRRAVARDEATYDHTAGNAPANYIYLKVTKIAPNGSVVP